MPQTERPFGVFLGLFVAEGDFGIVDGLLGGLVGVQDNIGVNAVQNRQLGDPGTHG